MKNVGTLLQNLVELASNAAGVRPPRVHARALRGGFAYYNPVVHAITVDTDLVAKLSPSELQTLLAHEVGHARQRTEIIADVFLTLVPGLLLLLAGFGLAVVVAPASGIGFGSVAAIVLAGAANWSWHRWADPRFAKSRAKREGEADEFANEFQKDPGAIAALQMACARSA